MLCSAWVGMGAGLLPRRVTGRAEIAMLAGYGVLAAYAYGLLLNLSSWPFVLGIAVPGHAGLAFVPGDPMADNLHRFLVYSLLTSTGTFDTGRAITNALAIMLLGPAVLASLRRTARRVVVTGAVSGPVGPSPGPSYRTSPKSRCRHPSPRLASGRPTTRRPGRRLRCPRLPPASGARPVPNPEEPMSALQYVHPASVDEAISWLAASPLPVDSPTQRRIRGLTHLHDSFGSGRRRPGWVWAVREAETGPPLGVVAAFGSSAPDDRVFVLDHFGLPADPRWPPTWWRSPPRGRRRWRRRGRDLRADRPRLRRPDPRRAGRPPAGSRLAAARRAASLRVRAPARAGPRRTDRAFFDQPTGPDDPRLVDCHRAIMRDTLDAHDAALVERIGFEDACRESLAYLLDADPVECIRLATDATGALVGLVSGRLLPTGRAFVLFVGVGRDHRGRGYGRELLAWQTRELIASGATVLVADTDNTNVPMARGVRRRRLAADRDPDRPRART